jgi:hypothetical protein
MTLLQKFQKRVLRVNHFVLAKKTVFFANHHSLFKRGRPYRVVAVKNDCISLKGENGHVCRLSAERFVKKPLSWTNFVLLGRKA